MYSKEYVKNNGRYYNRPFKLLMQMWQRKSKEIFDKIVNGELSKTNTTKILKVLNLTADAIKLIIEIAIVKYGLSANTLDMHNLNGFSSSIVFGNKNRINFLDFTICKRRNFSHSKLTNSPMHLLF